jgi:hypothetical protein
MVCGLNCPPARRSQATAPRARGNPVCFSYFSHQTSHDAGRPEPNMTGRKLDFFRNQFYHEIAICMIGFWFRPKPCLAPRWVRLPGRSVFVKVLARGILRTPRLCHENLAESRTSFTLWSVTMSIDISNEIGQPNIVAIRPPSDLDQSFLFWLIPVNSRQFSNVIRVISR